MASSAPGALGASVGDRPYFQMARRGTQAGPIVSEVIYGRASHTWGEIVARRIDLPDGTFAGMIGASVNLTENFSNFYSTLSLGDNSTILLRDRENRLLVRFPEAEEQLGKPLSTGGPINELVRAGNAEGSALVRSTIDNRERIFAFRKLENYPIYAIVGLSLDDALLGWRRNRNTVAVAALLIILAGLFITAAMRRQERADKEVRDMNEVLEGRVRERTGELSLTNRLLETEIAERKRVEASVLDYAERMQLVTRRLVDAQEGEQRRLARELHDRVSSNLSAIRLSLELLEKQLSPEFMATWGNRLSDCIDVIAQTVATTRDITSDLHPTILDYLGLIPALVELGEQFEIRTDIAVTVAGSLDGIRLPPAKEIGLFRIAQEALMNCAKHSHAKNVEINLTSDFEIITLSIKDDGVGFDSSDANSGEKVLGLGLLSMKERAQAIGGSCRIESTHGSGTQVTVVVAPQISGGA